MNDSNYDDIINLPHHISSVHPQMSRESRAAQFAPFSALSGYSDSIKEVSRLTDNRIEIDEGLKQVLNSRLKMIIQNIKDRPLVTFTYFVYDSKKEGGKYISVTEKVKKVDTTMGYVLLADKSEIPINEIIGISGKLFGELEC